MQIGDIYWLTIKSDIKHPHVIVGINSDGTILVCSITTNAKKVSMPKTIVLEAGEGNLQKQSIIEAYKTYTVNITDLTEYIGALSNLKLQELKAVLQI